MICPRLDRAEGSRLPSLDVCGNGCVWRWMSGDAYCSVRIHRVPFVHLATRSRGGDTILLAQTPFGRCSRLTIRVLWGKFGGGGGD